jgi:uncharacterized protein (TIGR00369 family)
MGDSRSVEEIEADRRAMEMLAESERLGQIPPLHELLGVRIERVVPTAIVTLPHGEYVRGPVAPVHGGLLAALADTACGAALMGAFDPAVEMPVSTDIHIRYFRQPKSWPITAEARLVHRGRTFVSAECVITDADERALVRVTGTYMIVRGFGDPAKRPSD